MLIKEEGIQNQGQGNRVHKMNSGAEGGGGKCLFTKAARKLEDKGRQI